MPEPRLPTTAGHPNGAARGNAYSPDLEQHRRNLSVMRSADVHLGLRRNAHAAAFASLRQHARDGPAPGPSRSASPTPSAWLTRTFEEDVAACLEQSATGHGELAWADRAALYQRAAALGLSRFDANLLMARVQHYHRQRAGDSGREWMWRASSSRWRGWSWLWGLLVLLGVLAMAWALVP